MVLLKLCSWFDSKYGYLFLERWQSLDYCTSLENWQPSVMAVRGFKSHPLRFTVIINLVIGWHVIL